MVVRSTRQVGYGEPEREHHGTHEEQQQYVEGSAPDTQQARLVVGQRQPQEPGQQHAAGEQHDPGLPAVQQGHQQPGGAYRHGHDQWPLTAWCGHQSAAASAASTTLLSSIARVIGPTPPGIGAIHDACSRASGAMSPTILPSAPRLVPTSSSTAPGLTMSAVIRPADPAAAITMSPVRTTAARSVVPVWHWVTVAFSVRRVNSSPIGRPAVTPRPTTTTCAPAIGTSYRRRISTQPFGVHGSGASWPRTSLPRLTGCRPSASLAGSIGRGSRSC